MSANNNCRKVYYSVVEDVILNVREAFLDEGVDEQVLQELKQLWEGKLSASRALDPPEPEPQAQGNIPYNIVQHQQPQSRAHVVQPGGAAVQQIPMPVQIASDGGGRISNAASMAFNAQGGMFPQQVQALVNVNPGAQITLQQTASGQYIIQSLPPGVSLPQGHQMISLPQQTVIQGQHGQQIQQIQGLPQLDGTHDEDTEIASTSDCIPSDHHDTPCPHVEDTCTTTPHTSHDLFSLAGATGGCEIEIEVDPTSKMARQLRRDMKRSRKKRVPQLDGNHDTSSSEDDNLDDDDDDNNDDDEEKEEEAEGEEEEPLNSDDDVSEEDPQELFDTDNVVVCQFEKISRNKSKWKFNLKDGIMNLDGKDYVFQKGLGEADW